MSSDREVTQNLMYLNMRPTEPWRKYSEGIGMVGESIGSIFRRKDGKYFLYLPKHLVEDTSFPFKIESSVPARVAIDPLGRKLLIELVQQNKHVSRKTRKKGSEKK